MIIITITKKPQLINYNNALLTMTKLLKNIIKTQHEIGRRNLTDEKEERGRERANALKEYAEFP